MHALTLKVLALSVGFAMVFVTEPKAIAANDTDNITISGTINLPPMLRDRVAPGDRLVLKLYHPDEGVEKDIRYWIIDEITFPRDFKIAPSTDMNGLARWSTYQLDVFTDRDQDVLNLTTGELIAKSDALIPLGTEGIVMELGDAAK